MSETRIQLPGHGDGWIEAVYLPPDVRSAVDAQAEKQNVEMLVYFRPRQKPLPKLVQGDALDMDARADVRSRLIVLKPTLQIAADNVGEMHEYAHSNIVQVWRDGECIWERRDG